MADIRVKDLDEASVPGDDYYLLTDSATDGVKKVKTTNVVVPVASGVSGLGTGVAAFLATPSSANLASALTDETGSGAAVFATSPTLVTPTLGDASATSVNKVAVTAPATGATLTIADGKTLTASDDADVSGTNTGDQTITLTGDVTGTGTGSFAATIGATKVTSAMLNSDVFSSTHTWSGVQTFSAAPIVPTESPSDNSTKAASTAYVDAQVAISAASYPLSEFGSVVTNGTVDMSGIIQAAINAAYANYKAGNGITAVSLPVGTLLCNTAIVPKSGVYLFGQRGKTILLTNNSMPVAQASGSQLVHAGITGITFKDSGSHPGATVLSFTAIMGCDVSRLEFSGYSTGTLMSVASATVTSFDDSSAIWGHSNSVFNRFEDWVSDGCADGMTFAGAYGATGTSSPVNSSNQPDIVCTQNIINQMVFENVTGKAFRFIKCADTFICTNLAVFLAANGAIACQIGDDAAHTGNNYVNSLRMQISISMSSPATAVKFFTAGNWTFGNVFDVETDIAPSAITQVSVDAGVTQFKFSYRGKNASASLTDPLGFNTNNENVSVGEYTFVDNGTAALPIFSFINDPTNGFYLPVGGVFGFTGGLASGVNGGVGGSLKLNGATSGQAVIGVSATGTPQYGGTQTNDDALAGGVGEYVSSIIATGSAVALTTSVAKTITSISLAAGDWDVWVNAAFKGGSTTVVNYVQASISGVTDTLDTTDGKNTIVVSLGGTAFAYSTAGVHAPVGPYRLSLSTTTTIYFVALASFGTSTCSAFGTIQARRRR